MRSIWIPDFFKRTLKPFIRNHTLLKEDLETVYTQIADDPDIGDRYPGLGIHKLYKIRVKASKLHRGKRKGFRLIYLEIEEKKKIIPLLLYPKNQYKREHLVRDAIVDAFEKLKQELEQNPIR